MKYRSLSGIAVGRTLSGSRWLALVALVLVAKNEDVALFDYLDLQYLKAQQDTIDAYFQANPLLTAGIYFAIYVVVTAFSLPGAAVMTLAGGAIFGLLWGTVIVSFASTIGATLAPTEHEAPSHT